MSGGAQVTSIPALRAFRTALHEFDGDTRDALAQMQLETHRALEWLEAKLRHWRAEYRRASDALAEARNELARCEQRIDPNDRRGCTEQKKAFEKARARVAYVERKIETTRKWIITARHEIEKFQGRVSRMGNYLDTEWPRTTSSLDKRISALDKYVHTGTMPELTRGTGGGLETQESAARTDLGAADAQPGPAADADQQPVGEQGELLSGEQGELPSGEQGELPSGEQDTATPEELT